MADWLKDHQIALTALGIFSAVMFVAGLVGVPFILVRIPADFFAKKQRTRSRPLIWIIVLNIIGWLAILVGIAMLVLPGQGLLSILLGLSLVDFPGKYRIERWIISRRAVLRSANWLRRKFKRPPLRIGSRRLATPS